ncbi:hypothetical protein V5799_000936 [Amblyomma americanum]|uniref:Uncharacterized protein n=1 Tax=Amblyomma americanum TaxID=6943 RepID=A0AAQ4D1M3_AMBAM
MAAFLYVLRLCTAGTADAALAKTDIAEARISDSGRTFSSLFPLTLGLMPLLGPVFIKSVFMVLLSGYTYLVIVSGSFFFGPLGSLLGLGQAGLRSFDEGDPSENSIDRVARVVCQAITSIEESDTDGTTQCRRRLVCELSKSVSEGVPKVDMFYNYFRNLTGYAKSYAGAWASGWLYPR